MAEPMPESQPNERPAPQPSSSWTRPAKPNASPIGVIVVKVNLSGLERRWLAGGEIVFVKETQANSNGYGSTMRNSSSAASFWTPSTGSSST